MKAVLVPVPSSGSGKCEKCGQSAIVRPLGSDGANICRECFLKLDPEIAKDQLAKMLDMKRRGSTGRRSD